MLPGCRPAGPGVRGDEDLAVRVARGPGLLLNEAAQRDPVGELVDIDDVGMATDPRAEIAER